MLRWWAGCVAQAMAFLRANPAKKAELTPTLQALIMRTRALKQELKSAE